MILQEYDRVTTTAVTWHDGFDIPPGVRTSGVLHIEPADMTDRAAFNASLKEVLPTPEVPLGHRREISRYILDYTGRRLSFLFLDVKSPPLSFDTADTPTIVGG